MVGNVVRAAGPTAAMCNLFIQHTSASLFINENADPDVREDLERFMSGLVRDGDPMFRHVDEGPDDMSAHVRTMLTRTSLTIPVQEGACMLGIWQGIYLWEHRSAEHNRRIVVSVW